jgi:ribosome-associated toxin RatA of RatAB toxin-antitoxin module
MIIRLTDGPFNQLDGSWRFTALGETACKVEFNLHYEFSSKLLEKVLGPVFNHIANTFVDSFVKRAAQVYAKR